LRKRDARKAELCRFQGVLLLPIDFTEPLTEQHIRLRIESERKNTQQPDRTRPRQGRERPSRRGLSEALYSDNSFK
jgi:hypothetical protein